MRFLVKKVELGFLRRHLKAGGTLDGSGGLGVFFFNAINPRARREYQEVELRVTSRKLTREKSGVAP